MKVDFWFKLSSTGDLGGWNLAWLKNSSGNFILALSLEFGKSASFSSLFLGFINHFGLWHKIWIRTATVFHLASSQFQKAMVSNQFLRRWLWADGPEVLLSVLWPKSNEVSSPRTLNYPPTAKMNGKVTSRKQSNICQQI